MHLKVSTFLIVLALVSTACAFSTPGQGNAESERVIEAAESAADETKVRPDSQSNASTAIPTSATPKLESAEAIVLPISIYILDDADGQISSARTIEQLEEVYGKVNEIWAQAGIVLDVQGVHRVTVSPEYLQSIAVRDFRFFFRAVGSDIALPEPSLLNGFYAQDIGGPNGIAPFGARAFFVTDRPSVHSERVSSHEVGHILGLHHTLKDDTRLMFPGTNGMLLTEEEIVVARYAANGLLAGLR